MAEKKLSLELGKTPRIEGDRESLTQLRDAIDEAILRGVAVVPLLNPTGELVVRALS